MDVVIVMSLFLLLVAQSSAQFRTATSNQAGPPSNCRRYCYPSDTYAKVFGATLCMCRSELCLSKRCGSQERCQVKSNLVGDAAECEAVPVAQPQPSQGKTVTTDCSLPPRTGWCRALIPRFYFDTTTKACGSFVYGGCGANGNNFRSMQECQSSCMSRNNGGGGGGGGSSNGGGRFGSFNNPNPKSNSNYNGNNNNGFPRLNNGRAVSSYLYNLYANRFAGK